MVHLEVDQVYLELQHNKCSNDYFRKNIGLRLKSGEIKKKP